ncbi:MAG: hypothetical protein ABJC13_13615 [Acidobacteriota bacterium]
MLKHASLACLQLLIVSLAVAQVTGSKPTPDEVRATQGKAPAPNELCPLQLDIELARTPTHRSLAELPVGSPWFAKGVADFVCDKAHFVSFSAVKEKEKRNKVLLVATPRLSTGWFRQDVNLTVQVLVNGEVKLTKQWEDLTIGSDDNAAARLGAMWASSSKSPRAEWWVSSEEFGSWFAEGSKPMMRLLLQISDSEEEND